MKLRSMLRVRSMGRGSGSIGDGMYVAVHMVHVLRVLVQVCVESSLSLKAADPLILEELSLTFVEKIRL